MNSNNVCVLVKYWAIIILASLVPPNYSDMCPERVDDGVNSCMATYNGYLDDYMHSSPNFHSGLDPEIFRTICKSYIEGYKCAYVLKKNCPEIDHSEIEASLAPTESVAQLCSYPHVIEEYTKSQTCYSQTKPSAEVCYNEYRLLSGTATLQLQKGDLTVINELCTDVQALLDCIKVRVRANIQCSAGAANLVGFLVKPSIKYSELCTNNTSPTTTKKPTEASPQYRHYETGANSASLNHVTFILLTVTMSMTVIQHLYPYRDSR